jgi:hypothetical protein
MSDTVSSSVLLSSLAQGGPTFIASDAPATVSGAVHVSGGAYADQNGGALIIDFQSLLPGTMSTAGSTLLNEPGPTVSGYASLLTVEAPTVVGGSLHHIGMSSG